MNSDGVFGYTCYCTDGFHGVRCEGMFRRGPETTTASPSDVTSTPTLGERTCQNLGKNLLFYQGISSENIISKYLFQY